MAPETQPRPTVHAARLLEAALLASVVTHAAAMAATVWWLLPGLPGWDATEGAGRVAYVAEHVAGWRLGWLTWQLAAAANVLLGVALLRTEWVPRRAAQVTLAVTGAAAVPDVLGQLLWVTRGVRLATDSDVTGYLAFEKWPFAFVCVVAPIGYLIATIGWTQCFMAACTSSRRLTILSVATWGAFAAAIVLTTLPAFRNSGWTAFTNAMAYVLLLAWLIGVTERVLGRFRPIQVDGRYAPWRHPNPGFLGRIVNTVANSHALRGLLEWLPLPAMASDMRDAVYVNYLVEADALAGLVPEGLELQRIGPDEQYALFTFVTFRHGHLGPAIFGPLRQRMPSPIQSNWRIYVVDRNTAKRGVFNITTASNSTLHALVARMAGEGLPMHLLRRADLMCDASGTVHLLIDPAAGTAPDARATLRPSPERTIPPGWVACFGDWDRFLLYCLAQERSLGFQPWYERVTRREVEVTASPKDCRRLDGAVESGAASQIVGNAPPLCFHVRQAKGRFARVAYDRRVPPVPETVVALPPLPTAAAA